MKINRAGLHTGYAPGENLAKNVPVRKQLIVGSSHVDPANDITSLGGC